MPANALRMDAGFFRLALDSTLCLRLLLSRYALGHFAQVVRTGACNGQHKIEQLGRWVLMPHDRVEGDGFPMIHEFLSMMLGLRRAGISLAAGGSCRRRP